MLKQKKFFEKKENKEAVLIALMVALMLLAVEMIRTAVEWTLNLFGTDVRVSAAIGFLVAAGMIIYFIGEIEKSLSIIVFDNKPEKIETFKSFKNLIKSMFKIKKGEILAQVFAILSGTWMVGSAMFGNQALVSWVYSNQTLSRSASALSPQLSISVNWQLILFVMGVVFAVLAISFAVFSKTRFE